MNKVHLKINGLDVAARPGSSILEAARETGIEIPTLCYLRSINAIGSCRVCVVEVKGARTLVASCVHPVAEGMEVYTNTPAVHRSRRMTLELILSDHRKDCLTCLRSNTCELQKLALEFGLGDLRFEPSPASSREERDEAAHLVRDNSKCILCRRCVSVCAVQQGVGVIGATQRGFDTQITCAFEQPLSETSCIACGQCTVVCPTGALTERDDTERVWEALGDPSRHVVVGAAPSVRAELGESFGLPIGTNVQGQMVAALRRLGFDRVFDVDTAADLTIMEEGTELLGRLSGNGPLPLITSCSPGWVKYCEHFFPDFIPNLSSCKSPQQMFGAMMKTYYAERAGIDPKDIVVVTIMPCTAKKFEITRDHKHAVDGLLDVDAALTVRELSRMIRRAGIRFERLPEEEFDPAFGVASGAGHIFGATGGVMEAALRTVSELVTGKSLARPEFHEVRGITGLREAVYDLAGRTVRVAVVSGTANAAKLLQSIRDGEAQYDFIEIMACPGGCVNGGGQPIQPAWIRGTTDLRALRAAALYREDEGMTLRKSHENPVITAIYETYLEAPGSHRAHELLHTHYQARGRF